MAGLYLMLAGYLADVIKRRWQYGALDCCTFMADWLVRIGLSDAMADRRGRYATRLEYRTMIKSEGGLLASCERRFVAIGLKPVDLPLAGAVALVMAPFTTRNGCGVSCPIGSICMNDVTRAVITPDIGLVFADLPTLRAWNVKIA